MARPALRSGAEPLEVAARAFARWRALGGRRRLSPVLWARAVAAARAHGVGRVAQALRLNWGRLHAHVTGGARPARRRTRRPAPAAPAPFVELAPLPLAAGPACRVEVHDRRGRRVCVELAAAALSQLPAVVQVLAGPRA